MSRDLAFGLLFAGILLIDITLNNLAELSVFRYLTKPLVLGSLVVYFYLNSDHLPAKEKKYTRYGLMSLFVGDLFILGDFKTFYLVGGIICFIVAKIFYFLAFKQQATIEKRRLTLFLSGGFIYATGLYILIFPKVGNLLIPVTAYFLASTIMALCAFLRYRKVNTKSFLFVLGGSLLFVICESISSINRFYDEVPYKNILIMLTYAYAQFFIVKGMLCQGENTSTEL
ncbi:lysoplasmalogenase [Sungkyunkwania multivorans]|uniref:Lysoplasmalogenase n=1 Tax=Sungkyunkwania multivorans TaxID=1173618 RepID=A0ABW3CT49_9FLAO